MNPGVLLGAMIAGILGHANHDNALAAPCDTPTVASLGTHGVTNATRRVCGQGLTCLQPGGRHGVNRTLCGWQIFPAAARTGYTAMDLTLDIFLPSNRSGPSGLPLALPLAMTPGQTRPAIMVVHGGSYKGGDSTYSEGVTVCKMFASAGFAAFSINCRMMTDNGKVPDSWPVNCGNPCVPHDCRAPPGNPSCRAPHWCPEVLAPQCQNASLIGDLGWMPTYAHPAVYELHHCFWWHFSRFWWHFPRFSCPVPPFTRCVTCFT